MGATVIATKTRNSISPFQALADPTRVRILRLLIASKGETCLCDLSCSLQEPDYKLSRHLKTLREAGLVLWEKEGRWVYHSAIKGNRVIDSLYRYISFLPDGSKQFAKDLSRFQKLLKARKNSRCTSSTFTTNSRSPS